MTLDLNKMEIIAQELYVPAIAKVHGRDGIKKLRVMMDTLRNLYRHIEPELILGSLIVFGAIDENFRLDVSEEEPQSFTSPEYLAQEYCADFRRETTLIQILDNGELLLWEKVIVDPITLTTENNGIAYVFRDKREFFIVRGDEKLIINPSSSHASIFAIPTFRSLSDALEDYKRRSIRASGCEIFRGAWYGGEDSDRLFFKNSPEVIMRKSLTQFLKNVLPNAEVRPEQNVDETQPVDIKITWMLTNKIALIEIKWMGKSIGSSGKITPHYDSRANAGAKQLADYLDENKTQAPTHHTVGYLVVIDARRKGLNESSTSVDRINGLFYRGKEVIYDPDYHTFRPDFAPPIRMFAEPKCRPN